MPQMWETMSDHFDTILQCKWAVSMALGRVAFIVSTEAALNLFVDAESRRKVEEAHAAGLDPPLEALHTCMQTKIGSKIYARYALRCSGCPSWPRRARVWRSSSTTTLT